MSESGKYLRQSLTSILARGDRGELAVRMTQKQPHKFLTRIPRSADNCDWFSVHNKKTPPVGQRGLAKLNPLSVCCIGTVCGHPAVRTSCAHAYADRASENLRP